MSIPMLRRALVVVASMLALAVGLTRVEPAQAQGQAPSRERTLFVSAVDERGEPVETLAANDVVVREDGARREVLRVSPAEEPMDIAVLIDNSAAASNALLDLRKSVSGFLARMAGDNNVALVGLAARPTLLVDYTKDAARLQQGMGRVFTQSDSGMTLLDGLTEISRGLSSREATRAFIVAVLTDGVEFTNRYARDVTESMQRAGVTLHTVTIGTFPARTDVERERAMVVEEGARRTGGQRVSLLTPTGLDPALQKLARQLSAQFKVVYNRPESLIPPERTEIDSARQGLVVRGAPARGQAGA